ncbi:ATP-dependent DNA helicase DDX11 isoform X2 [Jatropha curcas]|uniref:ATP-dependent DNA helicase DDX11 isoform X2 n=1 Tax=Jatropha curcas TaxID=180498 RepID=UPI0009D78D1E|nr:ATP-dependent DNA helicase DDX11 isoform X2 [Jatropha curcas]
MENEENEPKFPGFPYKPYSIQMDFMKALYRSLDKGGVSMLESPTGTGKTLSIICSSLQWVYDKRQKEKSKAKVESDQSKGDGRQIMSDDEPDWMRNFVVKKEDIKKEKKVKKKFGLGKQNERKIREGYREIFPRVKEEEDCHMKKGHTSLGQKNDGVEFNDEEFLLEEYESEDEGSLVSGKSKRKAGRCSVISSSDEEGEKYGSDGEEEEKELKIYFCSRTHSQLSQFVKELRKTSFDNEITAVCLGSRKNFCINEDVLKLGNATRINERCLELQKYGKSEVSKIKLDHVHSHIKKYFARFRNLLGPGNRRYIQTLMVVTRAFLQTLSSEKDWSNANTCQVEEKTAFDTSMAINDFLFSLNIDNINLVKLLHYIKENNFIHKVCGYGEKVASLQKDLVLNNSGECSEELSMLSSFRALVDMLVSLTNNDGDGRIIISKSRPTCSGRQGGFLKYVMLTGEKIFSEIVEEARAIILAGGTLQPIEETRERLFPWLPLNQLHFFSCSHIVPPESILPIAVSRGPSGQSFDFSYSSRSSLNIIEELGLLLCNVVAVVPEGIVVFFSSFEYEAKVYDAWKTSGILERIMKRKCIFREPRRNADVELVLKEYKETIDRSSGSAKEDIAPQSGAVLLAVVGGKISEGINFSDEMGRCIVMVGLPYPSPSDIELIERVKHIESLGESNSARTSKISASDEYFSGDIQAAFSILRSCKRRGQEYYENLCMKAVNQSIGRAIRHINDYAAILLVDMRYASASSKRSFSHPTNKLPQWIKDCLVSATTSYGEVHKLLHQFFKFNKKRGCQ